MKFNLLIATMATIFISVAQAQHDPPDRADPCSLCDGKFLACRNSFWCSIPGANCDFSCSVDTCNIAECHCKCGYNKCTGCA